MVTANYKHKFGSNLTWYTAVAATINGPAAHYDLGAGGHGVTTDCHSAFGASGGLCRSPIAGSAPRLPVSPPVCSGGSKSISGSTHFCEI